MAKISNLRWSGVGVGESWVKSIGFGGGRCGGEKEHKVKVKKTKKIGVERGVKDKAVK